MPEYEVSVSAYEHYLVEADSEHEADRLARENARQDLPRSWSIEDVRPGSPLPGTEADDGE